MLDTESFTGMGDHTRVGSPLFMAPEILLRHDYGPQVVSEEPAIPGPTRRRRTRAYTLRLVDAIQTGLFLSFSGRKDTHIVNKLLKTYLNLAGRQTRFLRHTSWPVFACLAFLVRLSSLASQVLRP